MHIALKIENLYEQTKLENMFPKSKWKSHRDGSESFYVNDLDGNIVEFIKYEDIITYEEFIK
jgi:catechol-2,3-dioxygenase